MAVGENILLFSRGLQIRKYWVTKFVQSWWEFCDDAESVFVTSSLFAVKAFCALRNSIYELL
jgi:hypothetical protein